MFCVVLLWCYCGATVVLQWCYCGATVLFAAIQNSGLLGACSSGHSGKIWSRNFYEFPCTFHINALSSLHIILSSLFAGRLLGFCYDSLDPDVGISRCWCNSWYLRPVRRSFQYARGRGSFWGGRAGRIFEEVFCKGFLQSLPGPN